MEYRSATFVNILFRPYFSFSLYFFIIFVLKFFFDTMSWIGIANIIIINIFAWLALSYFWSTWNIRVFKPWMWLELKKRKQLHTDIEKEERNAEDKIRFYAHWTSLEQIDSNHIPGAILVAGCEDGIVPQLANRHSPERRLVVVDPFESRKVVITRENCQGEVSTQEIDIRAISLDDLSRLTDSKAVALKSPLAEGVSSLNEPLALATVDTVDFEELSSVLSHIYPLVQPGGIIIVHDYNHNWDSVRSAVDRFEASVPESFFSLADMYGSVVMVKNTK